MSIGCQIDSPFFGALRGVPVEGGVPKTALPVEVRGKAFPPIKTLRQSHRHTFNIPKQHQTNIKIT